MAEPLAGIRVLEMTTAIQAPAAALFAREQTGLGQQVQTSALGAQLILQIWELQQAIITGSALQRSGAHHCNIASPYGVYRTADGGAFVFAVAMTDPAWRAFCEFAGLPDVAATVAARADKPRDAAFAALSTQST